MRPGAILVRPLGPSPAFPDSARGRRDDPTVPDLAVELHRIGLGDQHWRSLHSGPVTSPIERLKAAPMLRQKLSRWSPADTGRSGTPCAEGPDGAYWRATVGIGAPAIYTTDEG